MPFEVLEDDEGSVAVGWAGTSVIYAMVDGSLTAELGARYAEHVQEMVRGVTGIQFFADAALMTRYDLLARSAFVRMALANRRSFDAFTFLTWPDAVSTAAKAFAGALGENVTMCTVLADFEGRLLRAAPLARQRINPANWERFESAFHASIEIAPKRRTR
ncbi:MAG TPA: hypothetical protein VFV94_03820 [Polyangiaceae bacterium]|nr:hypothetical protein [Polyangiaceae bacterium]